MERFTKVVYFNCHFCLKRAIGRSLITSSYPNIQAENGKTDLQHSAMRIIDDGTAKLSSGDDREFLDFARGKHAGRMQVPAVALPPVIVDSVNDMLYAEKGLFKIIKREAERLDAHMRSRNPPYLNPSETKFDKKKWKSNMMEKLDNFGDEISPEQRELFAGEIEAEAERRRKELKNLSGFWRSIAYDSPNACLAYTLCRAAPNYAVTIRVLNEIVRRDPDFVPESVLDFGSGTGSFVWSLLTLWTRKTNFFYLNDVSNEFNNLSCSLLGGDDVDFNPISNGIYYKLHLPADVRPNFDLTFSGYTLSELNGPGSRIAAVKHLLKCTKKYLVIVENGTLRSHHLIEEVREYVATHFSHQFQIFAPCPHSKPCPLLMTNLKQQRKSLICRTAVTYFPFPIRNHVQKNATTELFTYLILRRRENSQIEFNSDEVEESSVEEFASREGESAKDEDSSWPRVVQEPRRRSGHVVLRLCCSDGTACESIVSKGKHPSFFYKSCKFVQLGDRLPLPNFGTDEMYSNLSDITGDKASGSDDAIGNDDVTE